MPSLSSSKSQGSGTLSPSWSDPLTVTCPIPVVVIPFTVMLRVTFIGLFGTSSHVKSYLLNDLVNSLPHGSKDPSSISFSTILALPKAFNWTVISLVLTSIPRSIKSYNPLEFKLSGSVYPSTPLVTLPFGSTVTGLGPSKESELLSVNPASITSLHPSASLSKST